MNKSLNTLAMNLGSDIAQNIIVAAVRLGMDRDDIYSVLTTMKDDLINPVLLNLNDATIAKARTKVITDKLCALLSRLYDAHGVSLCLIDRAAIQGRDWQTDMVSGIVRTLYIAKDIVDDGNVLAFDRMISSIVPFFFGERATNLSSARSVVESTVEKAIPLAKTAPEQAPMVNPAEEVESEKETNSDISSGIAVAVKNSIVEEKRGQEVPAEAESNVPKSTTTARRRPAVKVVR